MDTLQHVENLKSKVVDHGDYRGVAEKSGVTFHWLQKFAIGAIPNPGVKNIAKLEAYFQGQKDAA